MSDITEGIGSAIEGGLLGRALEPKHGEGSNGEPGEGACLNCGAEPLGNYCQNCGQKVHVHRTLSAIGHDLIHGVLHLDGKFWKTLPLLLFRPGKLTRRYINGERAKFVSPMAMFLFGVFAMFAVFQMVGLTVPSELNGVSPAQLDRALAGQIERVDADLAKIEEELAAEGLDASEQALLEERRRALLDQQEGLTKVSEFRRGERGLEETVSSIPIATQDADGFNANITGLDQLDSGIVKKWRENPTLMLYKLQTNAYKFSWLLIPLSVPFVWLLFLWKRRFKAYDHAIFVTYSLSFMTLLFIALSAAGALGVEVAALILIAGIATPIHLYKQLRHTYELGRFSAFWRLIAISAFIWVVLILFLQALLLLGAF